MASVAGGTTLGVASKANLVIVKYENAAVNPGVGVVIKSSPAALLDALDWIIDNVTAERLSHNTGKFIINMSFSEFTIEAPFRSLFLFCAVYTVCPISGKDF